MREGRPSATAANIALARAWLTRAGIVDDPYARLFLSPRQADVERLLWWSRRTRLGQRVFADLAARTRFYDAVVTDALDAGIEQVVLLGAGYDTRAWRLARPGVRYFNPAERTWDCPCHGSRFATNGTVLEGPAVDDLPTRDT